MTLAPVVDEAGRAALERIHITKILNALDAETAKRISKASSN